MADGSTLTKHWERHEALLDAMYGAQSNEVQDAHDESDLTCPLRDALKTTVLVDEVEHRLHAKENTGVVM